MRASGTLILSANNARLLMLAHALQSLHRLGRATQTTSHRWRAVGPPGRANEPVGHHTAHRRPAAVSICRTTSNTKTPGPTGAARSQANPCPNVDRASALAPVCRLAFQVIACATPQNVGHQGIE